MMYVPTGQAMLQYVMVSGRCGQRMFWHIVFRPQGKTYSPIFPKNSVEPKLLFQHSSINILKDVFVLQTGTRTLRD